MARHVVAALADIAPGMRKRVDVAGRPIVIFNVAGRLFAISNKCPHAGGSLEHAAQVGELTSTEPGDYSYSRPGEIIRCPWHSWEFDLATGQSWCDPAKVRVKRYPVDIASGASVIAAGVSRVEGSYKAETFEVGVDGEYVVVEV